MPLGWKNCWNIPTVRLTTICILLTFFWHVTHYGPEQHFSLHAASATAGWQALHTNVQHLCEKFYHRTTNSKGNTVTAKLGISATTGSDKPWSSILDSNPIIVRTKVPSAGISCTIFGFPLHCQNVWQVKAVRQVHDFF